MERFSFPDCTDNSTEIKGIVQLSSNCWAGPSGGGGFWCVFLFF